MKILIISLPNYSHSIGGEEQVSKNLTNAFLDLKHEVEICHRDNYEQYAHGNYDLIISLSVPIRIIDKKQCIWCALVFNSNFGSTKEELLSYNFDMYFTNSSVLKSSFGDECFFNFPMDPQYSNSSVNVEYKHDVVYLGNYNPEYKSIDRIRDFLVPCMDFNFAIYGGSKWNMSYQKQIGMQEEYITDIYEPYYRGIYDYSKCGEICALSKIFINFNAKDQLSLGMINNRVFDLINNGCFVITDNTENQKNTFGIAAEYSNGGDDLFLKIKKILKNERQMQEKRTLALKFADNYNKDNSYNKLASRILSKYENDKSIILYESMRKKIVFDIVVNDPRMLKHCIQSINSNCVDYEITLHCLLKNKIQINNTINDKCNVIFYDSFANIKQYDSQEKCIVIPSFSSVLFPSDFCSKLKQFFNNFSSEIACRFALLDNSSQSASIYSVDISSGSFYTNRDLNVLTRGNFAYICRPGVEFNTNAVKNESYNIIDANATLMIVDSFTKQSILDFMHDKKILDEESVEIKNVSNTIEQSSVEEVSIVKSTDIYNDFSKLRYAIFGVNDKGYGNIEHFSDCDYERSFRSIQAHYAYFNSNSQSIDFLNINKIIFTHFNYDLFKIGNGVFVKSSRLFCLPRFTTVDDYINYFISSDLPMIEIDIDTYDISFINKKQFSLKDSKKLKVAVLSMCGVSSYEDKYGIGGEHQVVHWLKSSFDKHEDVYYCKMFDTYNYDLMDPDEYDIIFSNSCWRGFANRRHRKDNFTIFWHFNMDSGRAALDTPELLEYDLVWTNSLVQYDYLQQRNKPVFFKHLNASSQYHFIYPYDSDLYKGDVSYIGGYQHYKGIEMIKHFIKPCVNQSFDFSIYGNRLWKSEVQKKALETDSFFKPEMYDESYDYCYKGVLPMQDFNILCKNTKVHINFNAIEQRDTQMLNDRIFWILSCGGFLITDDYNASREMLDIGSKSPVVFSTGGDDLIQKIKYYIVHEDERCEIASRGPSFVKENKLTTDDTIDLIIKQYIERLS